MNEFLWGALAISAWVVGLVFLRFWKLSRDRLFLCFFLAFWTLALNWLWLGMVPLVDETRHYVFGVRLVAFLIIIAGIIDKNRRSRLSPPR
jgi:hypothetical protein